MMNLQEADLQVFVKQNNLNSFKKSALLFTFLIGFFGQIFSQKVLELQSYLTQPDSK
jgi:hypothetical protein